MKSAKWKIVKALPVGGNVILAGNEKKIHQTMALEVCGDGAC